MNEIEISGKKIGPGNPCFIIAEAGVNHNGSVQQALRMVDVAYAAGADGIKFQLYRSEEQISQASPTAGYQQRNTGVTTMLELGKGYELPWEKHRIIAEYCRTVGIPYMSSCFEPQAVDLLIELGGQCVKVASGEISNYPLLRHIARSGLPVLLSTGMCTLKDVAGCVEHIHKYGQNPIVLFQCVSNYPAEPAAINLRAMVNMANAFGALAGYSDHTLGNVASIAAVALGACMIEKHFTLDKKLSGPDHSMSLDPQELKDFVSAIRLAEAVLGDGVKRPHPDEMEVRTASRRSIVSARFIQAGERLESANINLKRPATGIDPRSWNAVCGRKVRQSIPADVPITWEMLE